MPPKTKKIKLIYFVIVTLLLVGLVPLVLTGWFLSDKSAMELRAVENRYQTQLVQEKANQLEIMALRYRDLVGSFSKAVELSNDISIITAPRTEEKFSQTLKENPNIVALYVKPLQGESLAVFRAEQIQKSEIESVALSTLTNLNTQKFIFGPTQKVESSGEIVFTISAPVVIGDQVAAAVLAVVSTREFANVIGSQPMSESKLWESGLPMVFVVDQNGRAVFHPDRNIIASQKSFNDLKIVEEWKLTSSQIQSALFPFEATYDSKSHDMIGAYSTASFSKDISFGVIAMQDESRALASVTEMRRQTWMISLAFALLALLVGSIFARKLTSPLLNLVEAATRIAGGDLSTRVETRNLTEIGTLGETFNIMSDKLEDHIASLAKAAEENRELFVGTVKALAAAIDGKDRYTRGHSERVCRVSVAIGQRMNMSEDELEALRISALLHDIGKIGIDDSILKKPAALTDEEYEIMKTHPQQGYKIMKNIPAMKDYLPGMYMHHEMINGEGYPQGLKGDAIPLQAKIVSVADAFDAMTIDRPYSKGMELRVALERIGAFVGTRYDGGVVEALVRACNEGQIGVGVVKLRTQKPESAEAEPSAESRKVA